MQRGKKNEFSLTNCPLPHFLYVAYVNYRSCRSSYGDTVDFLSLLAPFTFSSVEAALATPCLHCKYDEQTVLLGRAGGFIKKGWSSGSTTFRFPKVTSEIGLYVWGELFYCSSARYPAP